jgi:hypothetical protein
VNDLLLVAKGLPTQDEIEETLRLRKELQLLEEDFATLPLPPPVSFSTLPTVVGDSSWETLEPKPSRYDAMWTELETLRARSAQLPWTNEQMDYAKLLHRNIEGASELLQTRKDRKEGVLKEAAFQLSKDLVKDNLVEDLIAADRKVLELAGPRSESRPLEALLLEPRFLKRRIQDKPETVGKEILEYLQAKPKSYSKKANGIIIFALGNIPEYTELARTTAPNPNDPDSVNMNERALVESDQGIRIRENYQDRAFGKATDENGVDQDAISLRSRAGGLWRPRPSLTQSQWRDIIRKNLREVTSQALELARTELKVNVQSVVFDPSIEELLFSQGHNPSSDLRLFKGVWDSFQSAFWFAFNRVVDDSGDTTVRVGYEAETRTLRMTRQKEAEPEPQVAYAEPYAPNSFLDMTVVDKQPSTDELELVAFREAGRILMGTLLFGSVPQTARIYPCDIRNPPEYWKYPSRALRTRRFQLSELLTQLAAVYSENMFLSHDLSDKTTKFKTEIDHRISALMGEIKQKRPFESTGINSELAVIRDFTPRWFHNADPVMSLLQSSEGRSLGTLSEYIITGILSTPYYAAIHRNLSLKLLKILKGEEGSGGEIPSETVRGVILEMARSLPAEFVSRLELLDPGMIRVQPENCDALLASWKETDWSAETFVPPKERRWRRYWKAIRERVLRKG